MILESSITKLDMGIVNTNYSMPSLDVLMNPKEANSGCIGIKFSYKGDLLAISFNNESPPES